MIAADMPDARQLGRFAGQFIQRNPLRALSITFVIAAILGGLVVGAVLKPSPEQIARAEAKRQQEVERQREEERRHEEGERQRVEAERLRAEAERQREYERQQALERARHAARERSPRITKTCVSIMRQQSAYSNFDAYVTGDHGEYFNYFGTAQERFQFEKCMAEHGVPIAKSGDAKK